eukprot:12785-Heterococcus_DN1.PRE.1
MSSSNGINATDVTSPLENTGILLHILSILGPGHHLYISAVNKAWRESYKRLASVQVADVTWKYYDDAGVHTVTPQMTLCSAVFASDSRVRLAHECGLTFRNAICQRIAGRAADVAALRAACQLGLELSHAVLVGAAEAASVPKLQWLHTEHNCPLSADLAYYAAWSGSIDTLLWLRDHGCACTTDTCEGAAAGGHVHVIQFLRDKECAWDADTCSAAAWNGHLSTLQWLHKQ